MLAPVLTTASTMLLADRVGEDLLEAGADERAGEAEDDAAVLVGEHPVVDVGGPGQVAGA